MNAYFYFLKCSDPTGIITYMQKSILDMLKDSDIPTISLFVKDLLAAMESYFNEFGLDDVYLSMAYAHKEASDIQSSREAELGYF
jgi:hypothetical protein